MSNLQKFNQTLEDFNQEVEQLKGVSSAYKKLEQLVENYSELMKRFAENNKTLDLINDIQKGHQEKVAKSLGEIENANRQNKADLVKFVEERTDQIRRENKDFYKDLEGTIRIKLDENRSQIKQLIEIERGQIKEIFEIEFSRNMRDLRKVIEVEANKQTNLLVNNQNTIKISVWIIGGLILVVSVLLIFKLW